MDSFISPICETSHNNTDIAQNTTNDYNHNNDDDYDKAVQTEFTEEKYANNMTESTINYDGKTNNPLDITANDYCKPKVKRGTTPKTSNNTHRIEQSRCRCHCNANNMLTKDGHADPLDQLPQKIDTPQPHNAFTISHVHAHGPAHVRCIGGRPCVCLRTAS